ncbi:AAA family ATPase [Shewanella sp. 5_MG-2023]|uniref:AAA family ATPase n=1 Tax=Shewanella sp. 5_MG-2023 TaxID=3062656 RepID=UPI0026E26095|nr:AAA family ATPase [Shewanella sp. 5_MG-2023]MDO6641945.1 AAA family ATPase [Shewanella sp. 5_MG-2023]
MEIRFIVFIGPIKESAEIEFGSGLNLVYGPSNTGKSSVLDGIDFMLGTEKPLKELPEHEGYDQVILGVEFSKSDHFTFVRSIEGGDYECFEGLHKRKPLDIEPVILRAKSETKKIKSISSFILEKVNLSNKKLKKNAQNGLVSLTLRNSLDLAIVNEANIQKESSPYISTQYTKITEHKSRLKFILTGVDDSSLLPAEVEKKALSRAAKIEVLKELIEEQGKSLGDISTLENSLTELRQQDERLSQTILEERSTLDANEEKYNSLVRNRAALRDELELKSIRINEVVEMLSRFKLLQKQYASDIARLESISETGTLLEALPSEKCPTCGRLVSDDKTHQDCDKNIKHVVAAAVSEKSKVEGLNGELQFTVNNLSSELESIREQLPDIEEKISFVGKELAVVNPELDDQRTNYTELFNLKSELDDSIKQHEQLILLTRKKVELENSAPKKESKGKEESERTLPTSALFKLSKEVRWFLQEWGLPNSNDVHFDKETGDFVINGKHRISNGKGHRAITHAAATLGLMKYTEENELPHLGFSILDSPLLAYEEPDDEADDLSDTDVNIKFFDSLAGWKSKQIIVFENKKSIPNKYTSGRQVTQFTKKNSERYGFFPTKPMN